MSCMLGFLIVDYFAGALSRLAVLCVAFALPQVNRNDLISADLRGIFFSFVALIDHSMAASQRAQFHQQALKKPPLEITSTW